MNRVVAPVDENRAQPRREVLPVTLVVAVRNEEATISRLLESIVDQTAPPDEIVIVDGGSVDRTADLVREYVNTDSRFRLVDAGGPATPGRGRNLGVAASSNEWLAFTDAGIRLEPTWLERLWAARRSDPDAKVVYGSYEFDTSSFFEECAAIAYGSPKRPTPAGPARGPVVPSLLVHRSAFDQVGGFPDLRASEDEIFLRALVEAGIARAWAPDARVWWRLRPDLCSTFERFRLYSYHNVRGGQQKHWHYPMARSYAPVALGLVLSVAHSRWWLFPAGAPVVLRVGARFWRHRSDRSLRWAARPDRATLVTVLVMVSDAAAALGWWQASRQTATCTSRRRAAREPDGR